MLSNKKIKNNLKNSILKEKPKLPKLEPYMKVLLAVDTYLNDIECVKDMFEVVAPILHNQDEKREYEFNSVIKLLKRAIMAKKKKEAVILSHTTDILGLVKKINRADTFFRSHSIVCLVSRYDCFLSKILSLSFSKNPERVTGPSKSLTYDELLGLDNLDNLIQAFANKEIEQILHDSHASQIKYLDTEFKIGIKDNFEFYSDFIELTERRNLFVHCGGVVNKQYIKKCSEEGCKLPTNVESGKPLLVSNDYFNKSFRCLYELGMRIGYALTVRLFPENKESILEHMHTSICFPLLCRSEWELSKRLNLFGLSWPEKYRPSEELRRYYIVNASLSFLMLNETTKAYELINREDWSSQSEKFKFAVSILKKEWQNAEKIMKGFTRDEPFSEQCYREYPIFICFRETNEFKRAFKKLFGKRFVRKMVPVSKNDIIRMENENYKITQKQLSQDKNAVEENNSGTFENKDRATPINNASPQ